MDDCLEWASQSHTSSSSSCFSILQNHKPSSSLFMANADSVSNGYQIDDIIILGSSVHEKNPLIISQSHNQNLFQHFVGRGLMEQSTPNQILNCELELSNDDDDDQDQDQILNPTTTTGGSDDHRTVISGNQLLVNEPVIGHHHHGYGGGINGRGGSCSRSMESLECLLSSGGTNSNTENSTNIEDDDGISMIFSHENCKSLWNSVVVSSSSGAGGCCNDSSINNNNNEKQSTINQKRGLSEINTVGDDGFHLISENPQKPKRARSISISISSEKSRRPSSSNINFQLQPSPVSSTTTTSGTGGGEPDSEAIAQMKEMIYRAAAFRPVNFGTEETVEKPKRKNVRISSDPQTVAARQRRERISERIRVLQRLVPGGNKMDTASMLDEAANYLKFLRSQVKALEAMGGGQQKRGGGGGDQQQTAASNLPFSSINPFNHSLLFPMQSSCFLPMQYPNS